MTTRPTTPFHMVQLHLDSRRLYNLARMLRLSVKHVDLAYLVHCGMGELFQLQSPSPFSVETQVGRTGGSPRHVRVLGYSDVGLDALQELAKGFASPAVYSIADWDLCASKPMPSTFARGMRLRFGVRVCPVIRKSSSSPKWTKGQEVDYFLSKVWEVDDPDVELDRETVYADWLSQHWARTGAAALVEASVTRFSVERMSRRTSGEARQLRTIRRPDVTLEGTLEVSNASAFTSLMRRGFGRHKSFGFGMLKVRRA